MPVCCRFSALVSGIVFAFYGVATLGGTPDRSWIDFAILTLKTVVIIGLLSACAKYGFTLGKSYVSESLKSADRIHAISFGKFFIRVFGAKAKWPELKDAFQHSNINRASTFTSLDTSQFDPKLIESLLELAQLLSGKVSGQNDDLSKYID